MHVRGAPSIAQCAVRCAALGPHEGGPNDSPNSHLNPPIACRSLRPDQSDKGLRYARCLPGNARNDRRLRPGAYPRKHPSCCTDRQKGHWMCNRSGVTTAGQQKANSNVARAWNNGIKTHVGISSGYCHADSQGTQYRYRCSTSKHRRSKSHRHRRRRLGRYVCARTSMPRCGQATKLHAIPASETSTIIPGKHVWRT